MPGGKRQYRKRGRKGGKRRSRKPTTNSTKSMIKDNYAKCSSIGRTTVLNTNTAYNFEFQLVNGSTRVLNVAKAYQEFKIDYVEVRLKPYYDTYGTTAATAGITAPQLYHQIIKDPSVTDMTDISQFRLNGINPMPFSKDGNKVWRYKPAASLLPEGMAATSASGVIKVSPWLDTESFNSTSAAPAFSTTQHFGSALWIDSQEATPAPVATVEVEIHYVFRKPRSDAPATNAESTKISL